MKDICVVIVTYNRKELLFKALCGLANQSFLPKKIVIINNNSSDNTTSFLKKKNVITSSKIDDIVLSEWKNIEVIYFESSINTGGSGGFKKGFELAYELNCDFIWAMDDDVCPDNTCLENLISNMSDDTEVCVPNRNIEGYIDKAVLSFNWNNPFKPIALKRTKLIENKNINVVDFAFEGPLFTKKLINKVGFPNSDYFIFFDDSDFAQRCLKYTKILYVQNAKLYKQIIPQQIKQNFNWRSYYICRNEIIFDRKYNPSKLVSKIRPIILLIKRIIWYSIKINPLAVKFSIKAYKDGVKNKTGKIIEPGSF